MENVTAVIIVGGGISGLAVALSLKQLGVDCEVYEQKENKRATTSAIHMGSSGVQVLREIGLLGAIEEKAQPVKFQRMLSADGALMLELSLLGKEQYGVDGLAMTRAVLHNVLTAECTRLDIPVHYNSKVISLTQDNVGVVVSFEGGRTVTGKICIGADGIHSSVRRLIFPDMNVTKKDRQYFGVGALIPLSFLSDDEIAMLRLQDGSMNVFTGQVGFVGFMGIGTPDEADVPKFMFWSHIAKAHVGDDFDCKNLTSVKNVLLQLRGSWHATITKVIHLIDQNLPNIDVLAAPVFSNHPLPRWWSDRVVLIGDSAHGYGPGASGAALALEDALLLARMLVVRQGAAALGNVEILQQIFADFELKRRPRVERIGNAAEARNDGRLVDNGFVKTKLREYMMWAYSWWIAIRGYYDESSAYKVDQDL